MKSDVKLPNEPQITSMNVLFARLVWAFFGPMAMFITLLKIGQSGTGWVTLLDAVFFVFLALTLATRWMDYFYGDGRTLSGDKVTPAFLWCYTAIATVLGVVAWIVANVLGNHVLV